MIERLEKTVKTVTQRYSKERGIFFFRLGSNCELEYLFEKSPVNVKKKNNTIHET